MSETRYIPMEREERDAMCDVYGKSRLVRLYDAAPARMVDLDDPRARARLVRLIGSWLRLEIPLTEAAVNGILSAIWGDEE